ADALSRKRLGQELTRAFSLGPVAEPLDHERRVGAPLNEEGGLAPKVRPIVLIERDVVDIAETQPRLAQTIGQSLRGEPRPVLDAPEALFLGRGNQDAVLDDASGAVAVEGIQPENDHVCRSPSTRSGCARRSKRRSRSSSAIIVSAIRRWGA